MRYGSQPLSYSLGPSYSNLLLIFKFSLQLKVRSGLDNVGIKGFFPSFCKKKNILVFELKGHYGLFSSKCFYSLCLG
jgi:hypothetical protein